VIVNTVDDLVVIVVLNVVFDVGNTFFHVYNVLVISYNPHTVMDMMSLIITTVGMILYCA
jgi:hypothetical protein